MVKADSLAVSESFTVSCAMRPRLQTIAVIPLIKCSALIMAAIPGYRYSLSEVSLFKPKYMLFKKNFIELHSTIAVRMKNMPGNSRCS